MRRRAVLVLAESERPHPRRAYRRGVHLHDAANDDAIGMHVVIVIVPLADGREADARFRISWAVTGPPYYRASL